MADELTQAKILYDRASRAAYTLRGKLASARKQAKWGTEKSAQIAAATIPSLTRKLEEAEVLLQRATLAIDEAAKKPVQRQWTPDPTGTSRFSAEELAIPEDLSIPAFLRRKTSQPDPVG